MDVAPSMGEGGSSPRLLDTPASAASVPRPHPLGHQEPAWHFPVAHNSASACLTTTPSGRGGWRVLASQMGNGH